MIEKSWVGEGMSTSIGLLQQSRLHISYSSSKAERFSIHPRLVFDFHIQHSISGPTPYTLRISNLTGNLTLRSKNILIHLGQLVPLEPFIELGKDASCGLSFGVDLSHQELREIEKFRQGKDLDLITEVKFVGERNDQPQNKQLSRFQLNFRIPKSDWVERMLSDMNFKKVSLIEIPELLNSDFQKIVNHVNDAWKQYSMGEYNRVLTDCRKALEELSKTIRSKGFEKEATIEEKKRKVPDWSKLFGNKELGSIIRNMNKKLLGFVAPGSHAGTSVNREDADFALMTTHGLVNLATKKLVD